MTTKETLQVGLDIGSTTVKVAVIAPGTKTPIYTEYLRHRGRQATTAAEVLAHVAEQFPQARLRVAVTGSGAEPVARALNVPFVQEVVANAIAVAAVHPQARCAIELGGQDAKIVFFRENPSTRAVEVADMRMNGSCAGGTGAFIDEVAALLKCDAEGFEALAAAGTTVYDISGRCGVYAKTDIQPLLNQGARKEDIALSALHAIAKQTIGGLAQGLAIEAPVIFEGGPLTFNPTLVRVFCERLGLSEGEAVSPEHPETFVAHGCALSLEGMHAQAEALVDPVAAQGVLAAMPPLEDAGAAEPLFASEADRAEFDTRHAADIQAPSRPATPGPVPVYLGIDSGSTTTKLVLVAADGTLVDSFYANNEGEPLEIARTALIELRDAYRSRGQELQILGCGTTGYGELLFHRALHADYHTVETVAHAAATCEKVPDATFILDIGGQDMKAMWLERGVVSDIVVNEACSSGCGSFLENFAKNFGMSAEDIAPAAFRSAAPPRLGSRCTVFMNSSVITAQRNGSGPDDIMAGLCRSIIENVFTKVIRVSNLDSLGERIVVQGGTFMNDAVLRAFEQYVGRTVTRAPHPGLMGAIGVALLTRDRMLAATEEGADEGSSFIGLDALDSFTYTQKSNVICPFCANHCQRNLVCFGDGEVYVTGNRCPRGEVVGDPREQGVRERLRVAAGRASSSAPDLFAEREQMLLEEPTGEPLAPPRDEVIGIPRALVFWDTLPFWRTLFWSLGFTVELSSESSRERYEEGLASVPSDTICMPAKLVHGHLRDLEERGVDRIFMPIVTTVPSENAAETSRSMCAVVKGYPMVVRSADDPSARGVPLDAPLFHWYSERDLERQIKRYLHDEFDIARTLAGRAVRRALEAQRRFRERLEERGAQVLSQVEAADGYAIVLAARPYHNDPLVNHGLPAMVASLGIPVLTADSVPGAREVDLSASRLDVVNNYHARELACAVIAARSPHLEYAQLVSFGCGHDAYLADEAARMMREISGKTPLVLKVDESDVPGPLRIRVRSFVETVGMHRERARAQAVMGEKAAVGATAAVPAAVADGAADVAPPSLPVVRDLPDPYAVKFHAEDRETRTVLIPNTSHAFSRLMAAAFSRQGLRCVSLPVGGERACELGKRYVNNDVCFPAQVTVGECLAALESGEYDLDRVAVATGKYVGDCRLTHYAALLRQALDDAGYESVPIITNDDADAHDLHPGFRMSMGSAVLIALGLPMIDALEELLRKIRPYETEPRRAQAAFDLGLEYMMSGLECHGVRGLNRGFKAAVELMARVPYDRSHPRPTVLIVGEYLLNFHPGANRGIERYLEDNGMEVIEARMTDVIRKTYFYQHAQAREFHVDVPGFTRVWNATADDLFEIAHANCDRIARAHPLYERAPRMGEIVRESDPIVHHTFDTGEGVLIPAEILHHARRGCRAFIILGPFGCLPNHIVGRGISAELKRRYPDAQILALDYDPDMSQANIENRVQMVILGAKR